MDTIRDLCLGYSDLEDAQYKELNSIQIISKDRIIDEDKSVKWNREEAERLIVEAQQKRTELRKEHIQARNEFKSKIYSAIQGCCDIPITIEASKLLYEYACEQSDSYGGNEVSDTIFDLINLIENMFKEQK